MKPRAFHRHCLRAVALLLLAALSPSAAAHSFGQVYNLPVPMWMYLYGAAAALVTSFLVVGYFVATHAGEQRLRSYDISAAAPIRLLRRLRVLPLLRGLSVLLLLLCVITGLFGTRNAYGNFNMTFFWVVFLLGFAYLTLLLGDLYAALNPWRVIADVLQAHAPALTQGRVRYPQPLGYWPALLLYLAFIWIELFAQLKPFSLGVLLLAYTALNLLGVWLIGSRAWFRYCEFLSVWFRLLAKVAPVEFVPKADLEPRAAHSRLRLRWPFAGLLQEKADSLGLLLFVLFMLASTSFDGLHETVVWMKLFWVDVYEVLKPWVGGNPFQAYPKLRSLFLGWQTVAPLLSPLLYYALYLLFIWLTRLAARDHAPLRELALRFTFSLIPIAVVYHVTHYYTLLQTQGLKVLSLASDPFGYGWNLFGTAQWFRAPFIPDMGTVWHVQVGLIVFGHIVSVYLAHLEALQAFATRRQATLSQLPMLLLMVLFTTAGLWILSQPLQPGS